MKKKILSVMIALSMVASMPMTVMAEDVNVASDAVIDSEEELRTAINLANTEGEATIVIGSNFDISGSSIVVTGNVVLKAEDEVVLNSSVVDLFEVTGELALGENITINSTNSILWAKESGIINVDGAKLNTTAGINSLGFAQDNGVINVKNGELSGTSAELTSAGTPAPTLSVSGASAKINISGGTVTSTTSSTILVKGGATAIVAGGTVKTEAKDAGNRGYVTIFVKEGTTGTIEVTDGKVESAYGAAVDANAGAVSISGGEFVGGENSSAVIATTGTVSISGGTFSSEIDEEYIAEDSAIVEDAEGNYVVASIVDSESELRVAVDSANTDGEGTIVIGSNFDISGSSIAVTGNVVLKAEDEVVLNSSVVDLFEVTGELTLGENITINSTNSILWAKESGVINVDGAKLNTTAGINSLGFAQDNGVINVKNGELSGTSAELTSAGTPAPTLSVSGASAKIIISGGTVTSTTSSTILVKGGATATVSGGTVKTEAKDAGNRGYVTIFVKEGTIGTIEVTDGKVESAYGAAVDANAGEVSISGGEFVGGENSSAVIATTGTVSISGGTFSSEIDEEYIADGYGDVELEDGRFTVHEHTVIDVEKVEATCTEDGTEAGTKCSECDEILSGCEVIKAEGHEKEIIPAIEATCTTDGATEGVKCSECGDILEEPDVISATHTLKKVDAKDATTTEEGNIKYYACEKCGKFFADEDGKTLLNEEEIVIDKLPVEDKEDTEEDKEQVTYPEVVTTGIYVLEDAPTITAGMCVDNEDKDKIEYRWVACNEADGKWFEVSDWTTAYEWLNWTPDETGNYIVVCYARYVGDDSDGVEASVGITYHKAIKGICQMPYTGEGGGYLIGIESYDNPDQSYSYEMLILDCTLLAEGKDAWVYSTGKCGVSEGNCLWTTWQPQYGYYWTLFRVYDADGNIIDEICYGFENIC